MNGGKGTEGDKQKDEVVFHPSPKSIRKKTRLNENSIDNDYESLTAKNGEESMLDIEQR
jgi:hypothetical protein